MIYQITIKHKHMTKFFSKCVKNNIFTGNLATKELTNQGYVGLVFYKGIHVINVEICGICSAQMFYLNPTSKKQEKLNKFFIERYINNSINPELLMNQLFSK